MSNSAELQYNGRTLSVQWKQLEGQLAGGEFRLGECLGGSETSSVFRTESPGVAIKIVLAGEGEAQLLLERWKLAAGLSHPNLIRLFRMGHGRLNNLEFAFLAMEFAEENLAQVLTERPLTAEEIREMLGPALDALAYIHEQGFVHGRLTPANILASGDQLKLSSDSLLPIEEERENPANDVWSLGLTVIEALTQRREDAPENLPEPFLDIARHCLERDPAKRWTVAEIQTRLKGPAGEPDRSGPTWRRAWTPIVAGFALAGIATVALLVKRQPAPPAAPVPTTAAAEAKPKETLRQEMPEVTQQARDSIRGRLVVFVRASVDPSGKVVNAKLELPATSKHFAELSLRTVRNWEFAPAKINGRDVASEWVVRFEFTKTETKAVPKRAKP